MNETKQASRRARSSKHDPKATRAAILEAAAKILARFGPEGLSVAAVAKQAKINRGTTYQHFQTREALREATTAWISEKLCDAVFGDGALLSGEVISEVDAERVAQQLITFAMGNPELGRVWLFEVLSSKRPMSDPFWKQFKTRYERFAQSPFAQPGIDSDVHTVLMLIGTFLWPIWVQAQGRTQQEREALVKRLSTEILRLCLYGNMRPEKYRDLAARISSPDATRRGQKRKRASQRATRTLSAG